MTAKYINGQEKREKKSKKLYSDTTLVEWRKRARVKSAAESAMYSKSWKRGNFWKGLKKDGSSFENVLSFPA